jgi:hypothetical protein
MLVRGRKAGAGLSRRMRKARGLSDVRSMSDFSRDRLLLLFCLTYYYLSYTPSPFCFIYFSGTASRFLPRQACIEPR